MAKGDVFFIPVVGSTGSVVRDYDTKEVVTGSFRHSQTVGGVTYSWKCGSLSLTGVVKLVEDEYSGNVFYRMEGIANDATQIAKNKSLVEEIKTAGW